MILKNEIKIGLRAIRNSDRYLVLFLILVTFTVFYTALGNNFFNLDDNPLVTDFVISDYSLGDLLRFDKDHPYLHIYGNNFRPLFGISFWLDFQLWFDVGRGYFLTNILFHLLNVIALYYFSKKIFEEKKYKKEISFIAALLFAIHPIHTESVSWIVGRQDLMAGFFILSALTLYLNWKNWNSLLYPVAISISFLLGLGCREIAVILIPLIFIYELTMVFQRERAFNRNSLFKLVIILTLLTCCMIFFAALQEQYSIAKSQNTTDRFALLFNHLKKNSLLHIFYENTGFLGFYLSKLIFPLPLNYAVEKINVDLCNLAFFATLPILLYFLKKRINLFLICGVFLGIIPNLAAPFFSWTIVAERYLYIPSIFFCIILAEPIFISISSNQPDLEFQQTKYLKEKRALLIAVFICFSLVIINRNLQWQDALWFWKNAAIKSPNFGRVWNYYGSFLAKEHFYEMNERRGREKSEDVKRSVADEVAIKKIKEVVMHGIKLGYERGYVLLAKIARSDESAAELKDYLKKIETLGLNHNDDLVGIASLYSYLADKSKTDEEKREFVLAQIEIEKKYIKQKKMEDYFVLKIAKSYESISEDDEASKLLEKLLAKKDLKPLILKGAKRLKKKIESKRTDIKKR